MISPNIQTPMFSTFSLAFPKVKSSTSTCKPKNKKSSTKGYVECSEERRCSIPLRIELSGQDKSDLYQMVVDTEDLFYRLVWQWMSVRVRRTVELSTRYEHSTDVLGDPRWREELLDLLHEGSSDANERRMVFFIRLLCRINRNKLVIRCLVGQSVVEVSMNSLFRPIRFFLPWSLKMVSFEYSTTKRWN